jgi:hypothetical protein
MLPKVVINMHGLSFVFLVEASFILFKKVLKVLFVVGLVLSVND